MSDPPARLRGELRTLREYEGLTRDRLARAETLCDHLRLHARADEEPLLTLIRLLGDLGPGQAARALRNALGVGEKRAELLVDRRDEFAELIQAERGRAKTFHLDTIRNWEYKAVEELIWLLLAQPTGESADPDSGVAQYDALEYNVSMRYQAGRRPYELDETREIQSRVGGLTMIEQAYWYGQPTEPDMLPVAHIEGARLSGTRLLGQGVYLHQLSFAHPLEVGQLQRVSVRRHLIDPPEQARLTVASRVRLRLLRARVQFAIDSLPSTVWKIDGLPQNALPGDPATADPVEVDAFGLAEPAPFHNLYPMLFYGIGWTW